MGWKGHLCLHASFNQIHPQFACLEYSPHSICIGAHQCIQSKMSHGHNPHTAGLKGPYVSYEDSHLSNCVLTLFKKIYIEMT